MKRLNEFIAEEWLESGEAETNDDVLRAWDRWRANRADWLASTNAGRRNPLAAASYLEQMELNRALARLGAMP
jgi:hypothetical protein